MKICEAPNDGLTVFLYDEASLPALREVGSALIHGGDDDPEREQAAERIAKERSLVTYELVQDDALKLGVIVGPPLKPEETRDLPWLPPTSSLLSLPSGQLCIESLNSLRLDPDETPDDRGVTLAVAPGAYVLTLHRVDWLKLDDYDGPTEIITLTPHNEVATPPAFTLHLNVPVQRPSRPPPDNRPRAAAASELEGLIGLLEIKADMSLSALDIDLPEHRTLMEQLTALRDALLQSLDERPPQSLLDQLAAAEAKARAIEEDSTADDLAAVRRSLAG